MSLKLQMILSLTLLGSVSALPPQLAAASIKEKTPISQFGAKGDGTSDDSKAFEAAIAAAAKSGRTLILAENKTYVLKSTLRIPKSVAIMGGEHTTLLFAPSRTLESGIVIDEVSGVDLENFTLRGSAAGLHSAIKIAGSTNIRLENLTLKDINAPGNSGLSAIYLANDDQIWITDSTFTNIGLGRDQYSAAIWNYYGAWSKHIYITHNQFVHNTATNVIDLFDTDDSSVVNNVIDAGNNCGAPCNNNGYGVLFYRTPPPAEKGKPIASWPYLTDETISGNQITNTAGSGIYLQGVDGATVTKNTVRNSALKMDPGSLPAAGIALNWSKNITIADNIIDGSTQGGIALATTQDVVIQENQIRNSAKWGINLRVSQLRTTIKNNTIDGAPIGILSERRPVNTVMQKNALTHVPRNKVDRDD